MAYCIADLPSSGPDLIAASLPNDPNPAGFYLSGNNLFHLSSDTKNPLKFNASYMSSAGTFQGTAVCSSLPGSPVSSGGASVTCSGNDVLSSTSLETDQTSFTLAFDSKGGLIKTGLLLQKTTIPGGCPCTTTECTLAVLAGLPCPVPITPTTTTTSLLDINDSVKFIQPDTPFLCGNMAATADPISTATGRIHAGPFIDLSLGGPLPLVFRRSYDAALASGFRSSTLGANWTDNFDVSLSISGNFAVVTLEGGGRVSFQQAGSGYTTLFPARMPFQLVKTPTSYRFLHPQDNLIYNFDATGRLFKIEDRNGNAITITPGPQGPQQAADGLGRSLTFSYGSPGIVLLGVQDQAGRTVSFTHDSNSNLTSVTDANGHTTAFSYAGSTYAPSLIAATKLPRGNTPYTQNFDPITGAAVSQTDSQGNITKLSYGSRSNPGVTTLTDALSHSTVFHYGDSTLENLTGLSDAAGNASSTVYDSLNRPIAFIDRLGHKRSITYDSASGYAASVTDADGNTTSFTYQSQIQGGFTFYNLVRIAYPDKTSETFSYDNSGNVVTAADRAGKTTSYTYNPFGETLTETNPDGGVTAWAYNPDGSVASVKDPAGNLTAYSYDQFKRLARIQFADGSQRSVSRDAKDQILSTIDESGHITQFGYDANDHLISVIDALLKKTAIAYDANDLPVSYSDRLANKTAYQFDALGSAIGITNPAGEKTGYSYDSLERLQSIADAAGKGSSFGYDAEGRLISITDALGNRTSAQADPNGRTTQITSPLGETASLSYDFSGHVTGISDALGRQSNFAYDPRGMISGITSPGSITTTIGWGNVPAVTGITDPNGNRWQLIPDKQARVSSSADPLGHSVTFGYDSRNRISSIASSIDSVQFVRDASGNLVKAQASGGVTQTYVYDNDNRLTGGTGFAFSLDANGRLIGSNGLAIARDAAGRITGITYAPGKTVTYAYDSRGLLASVTDWTGASVSLAFDDAHRLSSMTRSNGVVTTYTYDGDNAVSSITETSGTTTVSSIVLTRDSIGRVISADRRTPQAAAISGPVFSSNQFDAANQLAAANYDARGRLIDDRAGATYKWSAASRLLSYVRPDGSASAAYDGLGQRISRTSSDGVTQSYVIDYATDLPSVAAIQSGGSDLRYYVYTPEGLLLYSIDGATGSHRFYAFDETGSTTFLTGDSGVITDTYGISPYGDIVTRGPNNSTENPFTWQGQFGIMQEQAAGLFYARFRFYDASTQRFLSRDPVFSPLPREVNPYQYAAGNPVANGDPTGLKTARIPAFDPVQAAFATAEPRDRSEPIIRQYLDGSLGAFAAVVLPWEGPAVRGGPPELLHLISAVGGFLK